MTTWVVVADSRKARIFHAEGMTLDQLTEIHTLEHLHDYRDDADVSRNRIFDGGGNGPSHSGEPATTPRDREIHAFAHDIAAYLRREYSGHSFDELALVAAPHFMGALRGALDDQVAKKVTRSINKNLASHSIQRVADQLHRETWLN